MRHIMEFHCVFKKRFKDESCILYHRLLTRKLVITAFFLCLECLCRTFWTGPFFVALFRWKVSPTLGRFLRKLLARPYLHLIWKPTIHQIQTVLWHTNIRSEHINSQSFRLHALHNCNNINITFARAQGIQTSLVNTTTIHRLMLHMTRWTQYINISLCYTSLSFMFVVMASRLLHWNQEGRMVVLVSRHSGISVATNSHQNVTVNQLEVLCYSMVLNQGYCPIYLPGTLVMWCVQVPRA